MKSMSGNLVSSNFIYNEQPAERNQPSIFVPYLDITKL